MTTYDYFELRKYVPRQEIEKINQAGISGLKVVYACLLLVVPINTFMFLKEFTGGIICNFIGSMNLVLTAMVLMWWFVAWSYLILKYKSEYFKILVPINILMIMIMTSSTGMGFTSYRMMEFMLTNVSFSALQVLIMPTHWKLNWVAFSLGSFFFVVQNYMTYNELPIELFSGTFLCVFFFNWFWYLAYYKLKLLLEMILKNEKLVNEIRKIIESFPHSVLIESAEGWYTNTEFQKAFRGVGSKLEELRKIKVKIDEEFEEVSGSFGETWFKSTQIKNLGQWIKRQVLRLENSEMVEQHSVFIKKSDRENSDSENSSSMANINENSIEMASEHNNSSSDKKENCKIFNIKSTKVLWDCKPSIMHVFMDTTNILKLEEATNNIKLQKIMFTSISHEFRNPLNSILNAWDIVQQSFSQVQKVINDIKLSLKDKNLLSKNSEIITKFTRIGRHSSELLLSLVEDVLNLSKMESNNFTTNITEFNVKELIEEVYEMFENQCKRKNIKLILQIDESIESKSMHSDRGRIKQTLINLISNAYKFTYSGSITIQVKATHLYFNKAVEFSVADTGTGISNEDIPKLFSLFGMLSHTKCINPNGCGIGLTVSKKYVELLKGTFDVKSALGEGTTMIFTIPNIAYSKNNIKEELKEYEPENGEV
jgi:signal transduction histidine kinase/uncharacterized protein YneF (UPF0154 family)